jgi:hypothetical protein
VRSLCFKTVITISLSLLQHSGFSQSTFKNGIFLELGGSGALYSINYERQLPHGLVARLGFTYLPNQKIGFPITIGKVFWKRSHHLEIDAGVLVGNSPTTYNNKTVRATTILGTGFLGYRYQKPSGRMFYRAGFTFLYSGLYREIVSWDDRNRFIPWAGVSIGYRF